VRSTGWQPHTVRGFLAAVVRKKLGLRLESEKTDGERVYQRVETGRCILVRGACHQAAAALAADFATAGSTNMPNPTEMRFHPLMTLIVNVSARFHSSFPPILIGTLV
jgi:hypothetical protein